MQAEKSILSYTGDFVGTPAVTTESQDTILDLVPKTSQFSAASHSEKTKVELDSNELKKRLFAVDLDLKRKPLNLRALSGSSQMTPV